MCVESYSVKPLRGIPRRLPRDDEPAEQTGRRVVGMPLHTGRDLQNCVALQLGVAPGEHDGGHRAPDRSGRGAAQPPGVRDGVAAAHPQAGRRVAGDRPRGAHRADDQVRVVARHPACAFAVDLDGDAVRRDRHLDVVVEAEREAKRVEAGPEVGRGRRHAHANLGGPTHARAPGTAAGAPCRDSFAAGAPCCDVGAAGAPRSDVGGASGQLQGRGHRRWVERDHRRVGRRQQRRVGVLQPVPGDRADHQRPARQACRRPPTAAAPPRSPPTRARRTPPRGRRAVGRPRGSRRR